MKATFQALLFTVLLTGCNWPHLAEFRAQMGRSRDYVGWEIRSNEQVLTFRKPVLTLADLQAAGLYFDVIDGRRAVLRYEWIAGSQSNRAVCDITLLLADGRLAGVIFPPMLRDGLGWENIRGLLAMMGNRDDPAAGISSLSKQRLVAAGWATDTAALGPEFTVMLQPLNPRNRSLLLKLGEGKAPDTYSRFHLKLI